MEKISRQDIQIINAHSNWTEKEVELVLEKYVYSEASAWQKFLRIFFLGLGSAFMVAGITFFFAYNWKDLHKFTKLGMVEVIIVILAFFVLLSKVDILIKNIILSVASVLTGVLFAVFGQIYQTGANAYDFFLGWTLFIALWVLISDFAPLWLIFMGLLNTTLVLYSEQVAMDWAWEFVALLLVIVNTAVLLLFYAVPKLSGAAKAPWWLLQPIALAAVFFATSGISYGFFDKQSLWFYVLLFVTAAAYAIGIKKSLQQKNIFYLVILPFSIIIIVSFFLIKLFDGNEMFLLVAGFIITSITMGTRKIISLQKKWTHE